MDSKFSNFDPSRRLWLKRVALLGLLGNYSRSWAAAEPRVVALDWALAETMIMLGTPPLGVVSAADWARFVVEPPLPPTVADLGIQQEISFERLAALRPELILSSPFTQHLEPVLGRIAPCVRLSIFESSSEPLGHAKTLTMQLGKVIGKFDVAQSYIRTVEAQLSSIKSEFSVSTQGQVVLANFLDSRHVRIYGGNGLFQNVLDCLGLQNAWKGETGYWGFSTVGVERLATLGEVDFIAFGEIPQSIRLSLNRSPIWTKLPFVRANRVHILPPVLMFGALPAALRCANLLRSHLLGRGI